jgi:CHAT domain-containing protein
VTAPPDASKPAEIAWLARSSAVTVLPSVASLKALRKNARASGATKPYLGVGNPLLDGADASYAELKAAALANADCNALQPVQVAELRGLAGTRPQAIRGNSVDVASLRQASPLPETAGELCDVAKAIGANAENVLLGPTATEADIKRLSETGELRDYRILHFATHGAMAGEVSGSAEPGLLLTPPATGSEADDGYLSASEIAGLKLDADWVILSACNTAAGGAEGAEALSGLARALPAPARCWCRTGTSTARRRWR